MAELSSGDLQEWLNQLSLAEGASEGSFQDRLRDGVLLCRLVNKIKPNSIENVCISCCYVLPPANSAAVDATGNNLEGLTLASVCTHSSSYGGGI